MAEFFGITNPRFQKFINSLKPNARVHVFPLETLTVNTQPIRRKRLVSKKEHFLAAPVCPYWILPVFFCPRINGSPHIAALLIDFSKKKMKYYDNWTEDRRYYKHISTSIRLHLGRKRIGIGYKVKRIKMMGSNP
jgi:hypothetical protein